MTAPMPPSGARPRALTSWALALGLVLTACEPIALELVITPPSVSPGPASDGGTNASPDNPALSDAGVDGGSLEPNGPGRGDANLPGWSECVDGWQSRELAQGVVYTAFTLDAEGEGLYAYERRGVLWVGNTAPNPWIEEPGWVGAPHVVGLEQDARGALHLVYDGTDFDLDPATPPIVYAAINQGGRWSRTAVSTGIAVSSDLDTEGVTHVLFRKEEAGNALFYAHDRAGTWEVTPLGIAIQYGVGALRVDARGHLHIVYQTQVNGRLRYMTNASGTWVHEEISSSGYGPSLALDASGTPHVTYTFSDLYYAVRGPDGWTSTRVSERTDFTTALFVDAAGVAHVAGADSKRTHLFYATNAEGAWHQVPAAELVAPFAVEYTGERFLHVDPQGRVHIAWFYGVFLDADGNRDTRFRYARQCP